MDLSSESSLDINDDDSHWPNLVVQTIKPNMIRQITERNRESLSNFGSNPNHSHGVRHCDLEDANILSTLMNANLEDKIQELTSTAHKQFKDSVQERSQRMRSHLDSSATYTSNVFAPGNQPRISLVEIQFRESDSSLPLLVNGSHLSVVRKHSQTSDRSPISPKSMQSPPSPSPLKLPRPEQRDRNQESSLLKMIDKAANEHKGVTVRRASKDHQTANLRPGDDSPTKQRTVITNDQRLPMSRFRHAQKVTSLNHSARRQSKDGSSVQSSQLNVNDIPDNKYLDPKRIEKRLLTESSRSPRHTEQLLQIEQNLPRNRHPKKHINVTQIVQRDEPQSMMINLNKVRINNNERKYSNCSGQSTPKSILKSSEASAENSFQNSFSSLQSPLKYGKSKRVRFSLTRKQARKIQIVHKC